MFEQLGALVGIFDFVRKLLPSKTKLAVFQKFLSKKSKQAGVLYGKKNLNADQIIVWHNELSRGFAIALGSDIRNKDVKLNCDIIKSRIDGLLFYGKSQTIAELRRILIDCNSFLSVIRKEVMPDVLSPQFEPDDLKNI